MNDIPLVLKVSSLHVHRADRAVLRGISFTVRRGELVVLAGANGAGKSTLLLAIAGRIPIRFGAIEWPSSCQPDGTSTPSLLLQGGRVFQHLTVKDNLDVARAARVSNGDMKSQSIKDDLPVLRQLWNRTAGTLSGGERQVVAFAMAFVRGSSILLLDEPFASVDGENASRMLALLSRQKCECGTSVVLAEQRTALATTISDRNIVLADGVIQTTGETTPKSSLTEGA